MSRASGESPLPVALAYLALNWEPTETKIRSNMEEHTWAFVSVAVHCFLKIRTHNSSILWFLIDVPCSLLGSTATGHTAAVPNVPLADFAVNWEYESLVRCSKYFYCLIIEYNCSTITDLSDGSLFTWTLHGWCQWFHPDVNIGQWFFYVQPIEGLCGSQWWFIIQLMS